MLYHIITRLYVHFERWGFISFEATCTFILLLNLSPESSRWNMWISHVKNNHDAWCDNRTCTGDVAQNWDILIIVIQGGNQHKAGRKRGGHTYPCEFTHSLPQTFVNAISVYFVSPVTHDANKGQRKWGLGALNKSEHLNPGLNHRTLTMLWLIVALLDLQAIIIKGALIDQLSVYSCQLNK